MGKHTPPYKAEFITLACNAYDDLVAALKAAQNVGEIRFKTCVLSAQVSDMIDAALKKAGAA